VLEKERKAGKRAPLGGGLATFTEGGSRKHEGNKTKKKSCNVFTKRKEDVSTADAEGKDVGRRWRGGRKKTGGPRHVHAIKK